MRIGGFYYHIKNYMKNGVNDNSLANGGCYVYLRDVFFRED